MFLILKSIPGLSEDEMLFFKVKPGTHLINNALQHIGEVTRLCYQLTDSYLEDKLVYSKKSPNEYFQVRDFEVRIATAEESIKQKESLFFAYEDDDDTVIMFTRSEGHNPAPQDAFYEYIKYIEGSNKLYAINNNIRNTIQIDGILQTYKLVSDIFKSTGINASSTTMMACPRMTFDIRIGDTLLDLRNVDYIVSLFHTLSETEMNRAMDSSMNLYSDVLQADFQVSAPEYFSAVLRLLLNVITKSDQDSNDLDSALLRRMHLFFNLIGGARLKHGGVSTITNPSWAMNMTAHLDTANGCISLAQLFPPTPGGYTDIHRIAIEHIFYETICLSGPFSPVRKLDRIDSDLIEKIFYQEIPIIDLPEVIKELDDAIDLYIR